LEKSEYPVIPADILIDEFDGNKTVRKISNDLAGRKIS